MGMPCALQHLQGAAGKQACQNSWVFMLCQVQAKHYKKLATCSSHVIAA